MTDVDGSGAVGAWRCCWLCRSRCPGNHHRCGRSPDAAADSLIGVLTAYGRGLIDAAPTFIACHLTDATTPELAEDRFLYLLTRIGNLVDLAAEVTGVDPGAVCWK